MCISVKGGFWAHGWNITKLIFIYACALLGTHLQVRPVNGFSRMMAQTTRTRARMCLFKNFHIFHIFCPQLGGKKSQNTRFWGVDMLFQAKLVKSKNVHIIKTTSSMPTKFCTVIKTTKCPSWVVSRHALQIQDGGGRHLKNRKNCHIRRGSSDFDETWHDDALRPSWPHWPLKIRNFENPRRRWPPSWKIQKSKYRRLGLSDLDIIYHSDEVRPSGPFRSLKIWNFKNPRWRQPPSWKM